jgi:hypothetical protein
VGCRQGEQQDLRSTQELGQAIHPVQTLDPGKLLSGTAPTEHLKAELRELAGAIRADHADAHDSHAASRGVRQGQFFPSSLSLEPLVEVEAAVEMEHRV